MADKPILLFPRAAKVNYSPKPGGGSKDFRKPSKAVQSTRIERMFNNINSAFEKQRITVQQNADNAAPEMVLIFETRGTIEDFFKAVRKIPELKYLGDYEKEFDSGPEFKYESDPSKPIIGKLFFVLANNAALRELRTLWSTWKTKKQNFKSGETKWKHLFNLLYDIRVWDVTERIEETGILIDWQERVSRNEEKISFEIELWYRASPAQRRMNVEKIKQLINEVEGQLVHECVIDEINYHGLLINSPIAIFQDLTTNTQIKLFKAAEIMYIRPVGQAIRLADDNESEALNRGLNPLEQLNSPIIALLDGMPMQNHSLLSGRVDIYDPDNFQENYPVDARRHGTAMASVIIHGDLNDNNEPLASKLLVRPVMKSHQTIDGNEEYIPENFLLVDLLHRTVKEIMEHAELKTTIKVFNLSLGDRFRIFDTTVSAWAKLLDWLSDKYNVLFVVSAGNVVDSFSFDNLNGTFAETIANAELLEKTSIKYLYAKNRFRKIIAPAESINALTVGAAHSDSCQNVQLNNRIDLLSKDGLMSPISRMGLGYRKSIKPEVIANGGKILFRRALSSEGLDGLLKVNAVPPGIKVASPLNGINSVVFTKGTSNSAALVSHHIGKLYQNLYSNQEMRSIINGGYFPAVAKGLIVHSASWDKNLSEFLQELIDTRENKRDVVARFFGYGKIDPERISECTSNRVTLIGFDSLQPEHASVYDLPLPNSLSSKVLWRKLAITLAYFTPVNCNNIIYRTHKLWFDFLGNDLNEKLKIERAFYNDDTVRRGTVQHEIFYGERATAFEDNSNLKIRVNCKTDAIKFDLLTSREQKNLKAVKYALIVTLEVDPEIQTDIYNELLLRIKPPIQIT